MSRELSIGPGAVGEAILSCPSTDPDLQAVGGGAIFDGAPADGDRLVGNGPGVITANGAFAPPADGQRAATWRVQAVNGGTVTRTLEVYVSCLVAEQGHR